MRRPDGRRGFLNGRFDLNTFQANRFFLVCGQLVLHAEKPWRFGQAHIYTTEAKGFASVYSAAPRVKVTARVRA